MSSKDDKQQDSKIVGFTGTRESPTIVDQQELVEFLQKYVAMAQAGDIIGVAIVCAVPGVELPISETLGLPGASPFQLVGGMSVTLAEMQMHRFLDGNLEEIVERVVNQIQSR
jgi:hypothetical protein